MGVCEPTVYVGGSMKVGKFLIDGVNFCAPFVESGLLGGRFAGVGCGHWGDVNWIADLHYLYRCLSQSNFFTSLYRVGA